MSSTRKPKAELEFQAESSMRGINAGESRACVEDGETYCKRSVTGERLEV